MKDREQLIQDFIKIHMNNPSLSEDIDYLDDNKRLKFYTEQAEHLSSNLKDMETIVNELRESLK